MATIQTGKIDPIMMLLLQGGFGQGRQQGFANLLNMWQARQGQRALDAQIQAARRKQLFDLIMGTGNGNGLAEIAAGAINPEVLGGGLAAMFGGQQGGQNIFKAIPVGQ